jgi:diguanylate cyclase
MFTGADVEVAERVMDQVRAFLAECGFNYQGQHIPLTASFGVTRFAVGESVDDAIARADAALYQAKNGGRNRVVRG